MDGKINMNTSDVWTIKILEQEIEYFTNKYESMNHDGGRYNTTVSVLTERLTEIKEKNLI